MGSWEWLVVVCVVALLLVVRLVPELRHRSDPVAPPFSLALWLAQGFGIGRIPAAPGTFGSLLGLGWFALLTARGDALVLIAGSAAAVVFSVWCCGVAEKMLKQRDPGSVVLDEIVAMPLCFFAWAGIQLRCTGALPHASYFFGQGNWPIAVGIFIAFRVFDVLKPWPVRQSQALPGGWGVTIDDLLAAAYVNALVLLGFGIRSAIGG